MSGDVVVSIFVLLFLTQGRCHNRLLAMLKPVIEMHQEVDAAFVLDEAFLRSVVFTIPKEDYDCVSVAGDMSLFYERFIAFLQPYIPPMVVSDVENRLKCRAELLAVDDVTGLREVMKSVPLWASYRYYCLIHRGTSEAIMEMYLNDTRMFGSAEMTIFKYKSYERGLKTGPPDYELHAFDVPVNGSWPKTAIRDLRGMKIRFTTSNCPLYSYVGGDGSDLSHFSGFEWNVFKEIVLLMNLSAEFVKPLPGVSVVGRYYTNGTWRGGIFGLIAQKSADLGFCGFWIDWRKLAPKIRMSSPFQRICYLFIVPRPKLRDDLSLGFTSFTPNLYALIFVTIIIFSTTMQFMAHQTEFFDPNNNKRFWSWKFCCFVVYGILLQGYYPSPSNKLGSLRRMIFLWTVFSMLMGASFSSQLVSHFTSPPYTRKPRSLEDLVRWKYSYPYTGSPFPWEGLLDKQNRYVHMWKNRTKHIKDFEEQVEILDTMEKQALLGMTFDNHLFLPYGVKKPIPEKVLRKYEIMDVCVGDIYVGFVLQEGSPFLRIANRYISIFRQYGITTKFMNEALLEFSKEHPGLGRLSRTTASSRKLRPLSAFHLSGVMVAKDILSVVSCVVFLSEIIVHKVYKKSAKNKAIPT